MHGNWLGVILSVALIGFGYVLHELIRKKDRFLARKVLHILVSNWYFIYAHCFADVYIAVMGLIAFAAINLFLEIRVFHTRRYGTVYYPMSLIALICLQDLNHASMAAVGCGILVMGYGDGLAAIVGNKVESRYLPLLRDKTVAGSLTMFAVSALVILCVAKCSVLYALLIGLVATIFEAYIPFGLDNISVPVIVYFLVDKVCSLG